MTNTVWLTTSYIALWILVIALLALWIVIIRQVGVLHERLGPRRLLDVDSGPQVGEKVQLTDLNALTGDRIDLYTPGKETLLLFLGASCTICHDLAPSVTSLIDDYKNTVETVVMIVSGSSPEVDLHSGADDFAVTYQLPRDRCAVGDEVAVRLAIAETPTAMKLDERGVVTGRSLPNTLEDLESLLHIQVPVSTEGAKDRVR